MFVYTIARHDCTKLSCCSVGLQEQDGPSTSVSTAGMLNYVLYVRRWLAYIRFWCTSLSFSQALTRRVVGAPPMILEVAAPISVCLPQTFCDWKVQSCALSDVVFPPLPLSSPSSGSPHSALQDGLCQAG